jgi:hypothetical protein
MKGPLLPGMGEFFPPKPTLEFSHDQIAFVHPSPLDYGRISHAWRLVPEAPCQDQRHWHVSFGSITTNDIDIYIATVLRWSSPHGLPRRHHTTPRPVLDGAYICTKRQHLRQGCELHLAVQAPDGIHTATLCLTFFLSPAPAGEAPTAPASVSASTKLHAAPPSASAPAASSSTSSLVLPPRAGLPWADCLRYYCGGRFISRRDTCLIFLLPFSLHPVPRIAMTPTSAPRPRLQRASPPLCWRPLRSRCRCPLGHVPLANVSISLEA